VRLITILIVLILISALTANRADAESIPLRREGGVLVLPVQVNDRITLDFTIDSGAADVVIPADVFSTLSRTGTITSKDMMASQVYELADGARQEARRFRIRTLKIGNLELRNIVGSVTPAGGTLLLGQSFLSHLPSWSIDNRHGLLVIADAGSHGESQSSAAASGPDGLFSYGDWRSNIVPNENGWTLASTKNDNGEFLSKYCQVNNACLWRIDASVGPCDKNDQSQVLINGGGVLEGSTVTCLGKVNENWVWRIEDRHAIENVLKRSTAVTITFPLDDSVHLREIGFSGRGAVKATAKIGASIVGGQRERTQDVTY
jgi:clan AA aspartic protease (TIGR02281 family)